MKIKPFRLLGLSTVFTLALSNGVTSCKKDKDDGLSSQFSATINANAFKPTVVSAISSNGYIDVMGGQIIPGDSLFLDLTIPDTAKINSSINFSGDAGLELATFSASKLYSGNVTPSHGSVTVTTLDKTNKKIAGKFSGVIYNAFGGYDSVVIKDGQFNTTYKTY